MLRIDGDVHVQEIWTGTENDDIHHGTADGDQLDALAGDDRIFGEDGDDVLHGGPGKDFMFGGDGNDTIYDTDGNDYADGGYGDDTITLGAANGSNRVKAFGGAGDDTIIVHGVASVEGGGGDDFITLGACNVLNNGVSGGAGQNDALLITADVVFRGDFRLHQSGLEIVSADNAFTGSDASQVLDFGGAAALPGHPAGLTIFSQGGDDVIGGTERGDQLHGGDGSDILAGNGGNDTLYGDAGLDELDGDNGDDEIHADGGDHAMGGFGNDTLFVTGSAAAFGDVGDDIIDCVNQRISDRLSGGLGLDTLVVEAGCLTPTDFDMKQQSLEVLDPEAPIYGSGHNNRMVFGWASLVDGATGAIFYGEDGNDFIQALNDSTDQVHGGLGDDHLLGMSGNDTLWGDQGHNTLDGGAGDDTVNGGANDLILGGGGADDIEVTGIAQPDLAPAQVIGGAGDDIIRVSNTTLEVMGPGHRGAGLPGAQKGGFDGGAGTDTFVIGGGLIIDADTFLLRKSGFEVLESSVSFDCGSTANLIDLHGVQVTGTLGGASTNGEGGDDTLIGTGGTDLLVGGSGNDDLQGGAGADSLFGSDGNDTLEGGQGDDSLQGEAGTDTLSYAQAISGVIVSLAITAAQNTHGAGTDTASGFEDLTGSRFADRLTGDGGDNLIIGGLGADTLAGGAGSDTFSFGISDSTRGKADLITDLSDADLIDVGGITHAFHLVGSFSGAAGEATLKYDAGADLTTLSIDADGDGHADSVIAMSGDHTDFSNFAS